MLIIPAIDLKDGQCVRLRKGLMEDILGTSNDPTEIQKAVAAKLGGGYDMVHLKVSQLMQSALMKSQKNFQIYLSKLVEGFVI